MYYRFEGFNDTEGWRTPTDLESFENRIVGEYVRPASDWNFSLGRDLEREPDDLELCDSTPDEVIEEWARMEKLSYSVPHLGHSHFTQEEVLSGFFGGQMYSQREGYESFPAYRTLYSPKEGGSEQFGLFIWFDGAADGKISILFDPQDHSNVIAVTD